MSPQKLVEFMNKGSNVFLAASHSTRDPVRDFAKEFGIDLAPRDTHLVDHFNFHKNSSEKHTLVNLTPLTGLNHILSSSSPILYRGSAHGLSNSEFLIPILAGNEESYTFDSTEEMDSSQNPWVVGTQAFVVSAFQANNNARLVVSSSLEMLSNEFFELNNNNVQFAKDITSWTFQESGVIKTTRFDHHHPGQESSEEEPSVYRVGDEVVVNLGLSEYRDGKWVPFEADDIQLSTIMLDPYIRSTFPPPILKSSDSALYTLKFKLPDHYGVFHFKIDYRRAGLSYIEERKQFTLRHVRHDEYPRFISSAWVYYTSAGTIFIGWFGLVLVWISMKPNNPLQQGSKKSD